MIQINHALCVGCGICESDCFPDALKVVQGKAVLTYPEWCICCGHCIAVCPVEAISDNEQNMNEVRRLLPDDYHVEPQKLKNLIQFRRANRHFKADSIPEETVRDLLDAGRWCPTAKNRQGTGYIVVHDAIAELKDLAVAQLSQLGQASLLSGRQPDMVRRAKKFVAWEEQLRSDPNFDPLFFHAPLLLVITSDQEGVLDAAGAAAYIELQALSFGLGVLYSGYFIAAAQNSTSIRERLGIWPDHQPVRCLVLGWPDIRFQRTVPRNSAMVRRI